MYGIKDNKTCSYEVPTPLFVYMYLWNKRKEWIYWCIIFWNKFASSEIKFVNFENKHLAVLKKVFKLGKSLNIWKLLLPINKGRIYFWFIRFMTEFSK